MIASLNGVLESLGSDWAIINVGGIGFHVHMPSSTVGTLGTVGREVHLHTHLHVREDSMALYGFASTEELELFEVLLSVSGFGPKLALAVLSTMSVEQVSMAIATGSVDLLTMVPGIGKKTAQRLVLELKDKIAARIPVAPTAQLAQEDADLMAALASLGYSLAEASRAIAALPRSANLSLEEKVKQALQYFAAK